MFIAILTLIFDESFPKSWIKVRHNKKSTSWITKGIGKSSKRKLYEEFLKNRTLEHEMNYKNHSKLFASVKRKSKFFLLQTTNPVPRRC